MGTTDSGSEGSCRPHAADYAVLVLLPFGALILPLLGWVVGVIWLWQSPVWARREKLVGTFVLPGGCATGLLVNWQLSGSAVAGATSRDGIDLVLQMLLVASLAAPIAVAAWLATRLRRSGLEVGHAG